jgi:hypothetical protein
MISKQDFELPWIRLVCGLVITLGILLGMTTGGVYGAGPTDSPNPKALQTYGVPLLGSQAEQRIKIDPPALELRVTTQPGNVVLRCGDNHQAYTCKAGQPTVIVADTPITEFWVQHHTEENANLQVGVYRYAKDPADSSET